jgi:hypothetical protein
MDAISASVGRRLVGLTVQTLMNRMSILLGWCFAVTPILSNGTEVNRHETESFFGLSCNRIAKQRSSNALLSARFVREAHAPVLACLDRRAL